MPYNAPSCEYIHLVVGDTRPVLELQCKEDCPSNTVMDLSNASVVNLIFKKPGTHSYKFKRPCMITDPIHGLVEFTFQTGDLDTSGDFNGELEVTFVDSTIQTSKLIHFRVRDQLG